MYFLFENTNISTKNSCIKHTTCINVIKRPLKCGQIHIYNKNIIIILCGNCIKRHRIFRYLCFSVRSRHTIRRSESAVWEGSPADARAKRPVGPEVTADGAFVPGGGTSPSLFGATASSGMAGLPPYPETRA